jgi:hypothetical protein
MGRDVMAFGPDVSYWPEWIMTRAGRTAHLEALTNGRPLDRTLCGIELHGQAIQHRPPDVAVCRSCEQYAQAHDRRAS